MDPSIAFLVKMWKYPGPEFPWKVFQLDGYWARCQGRFDDICSQMLEQCDESLLQLTKHALLLDTWIGWW